MDGRLAGKKALVTGSGTGIGREIALEFAREGADVVLHYSHSDSGANSAVEEILDMGRKATAFRADFRCLDEIISLAEQAIGFLGGIDCLVNNAGITFNKPFLQVTEEQFDTAFQVNIRGQFFLTQKIVSEMLTQGGGTVCNIASIHGISGVAEHSVYAATKGAIIAYTRSLAVELAHKHIRVNALAPGMIVVESYNKVQGFSEERAEEMARERIPAGRHGVPIDIAKIAAFLCSDEADFIVGQTIVADGGTTSLMSLMSDFRNELPSSLGKGYIPGI